MVGVKLTGALQLLVSLPMTARTLAVYAVSGVRPVSWKGLVPALKMVSTEEPSSTLICQAVAVPFSVQFSVAIVPLPGVSVQARPVGLGYFSRAMLTLSMAAGGLLPSFPSLRHAKTI